MPPYRTKALIKARRSPVHAIPCITRRTSLCHVSQRHDGYQARIRVEPADDVVAHEYGALPTPEEALIGRQTLCVSLDHKRTLRIFDKLRHRRVQPCPSAVAQPFFPVPILLEQDRGAQPDPQCLPVARFERTPPVFLRADVVEIEVSPPVEEPSEQEVAFQRLGILRKIRHGVPRRCQRLLQIVRQPACESVLPLRSAIAALASPVAARTLAMACSASGRDRSGSLIERVVVQQLADGAASLLHVCDNRLQIRGDSLTRRDDRLRVTPHIVHEHFRGISGCGDRATAPRRAPP